MIFLLETSGSTQQQPQPMPIYESAVNLTGES